MDSNGTITINGGTVVAVGTRTPECAFDCDANTFAVTVPGTMLISCAGVVLSSAALLGFRGVEFATLIGIFASPCAVAGFAMAQQMDSDAELAGNCVVFTTALSCLTLFGWIVLFHTLGVL